MPVTVAAQKLRRFRHRFGIRAPRVKVHAQFAWYAYALAGAAAAFLIVAILVLVRQGLQGPGGQDIGFLRDRLAQLESEVLRGGGAVSSLEMTHSANRQLAGEVKLLVDENAALKDDLAYFLRLVPVGSREGEARLERLMLLPNPEAPNRFSYSVLVGYQSGRQTSEFAGGLELHVTVVRGGREVAVKFPTGESDAAAYGVRTRQWLRKEGEIELLPGDQLRRVEARLLQGRMLKASTSATL